MKVCCCNLSERMFLHFPIKRTPWSWDTNKSTKGFLICQSNHKKAGLCRDYIYLSTEGGMGKGFWCRYPRIIPKQNPLHTGYLAFLDRCTGREGYLVLEVAFTWGIGRMMSKLSVIQVTLSAGAPRDCGTESTLADLPPSPHPFPRRLE